MAKAFSGSVGIGVRGALAVSMCSIPQPSEKDYWLRAWLTMLQRAYVRVHIHPALLSQLRELPSAPV